jgi:hypothetical protein
LFVLLNQHLNLFPKMSSSDDEYTPSIEDIDGSSMDDDSLSSHQSMSSHSSENGSVLEQGEMEIEQIEELCWNRDRISIITKQDGIFGRIINGFKGEIISLGRALLQKIGRQEKDVELAILKHYMEPMANFIMTYVASEHNITKEHVEKFILTSLTASSYGVGVGVLMERGTTSEFLSGPYLLDGKTFSTIEKHLLSGLRAPEPGKLRKAPFSSNAFVLDMIDALNTSTSQFVKPMMRTIASTNAVVVASLDDLQVCGSGRSITEDWGFVKTMSDKKASKEGFVFYGTVTGATRQGISFVVATQDDKIKNVRISGKITESLVRTANGSGILAGVPVLLDTDRSNIFGAVVKQVSQRTPWLYNATLTTGGGKNRYNPMCKPGTRSPTEDQYVFPKRGPTVMLDAIRGDTIFWGVREGSRFVSGHSNITDLSAAFVLDVAKPVGTIFDESQKKSRIKLEKDLKGPVRELHHRFREGIVYWTSDQRNAYWKNVRLGMFTGTTLLIMLKWMRCHKLNALATGSQAGTVFNIYHINDDLNLYDAQISTSPEDEAVWRISSETGNHMEKYFDLILQCAYEPSSLNVPVWLQPVAGENLFTASEDTLRRVAKKIDVPGCANLDEDALVEHIKNWRYGYALDVPYDTNSLSKLMVENFLTHWQGNRYSSSGLILESAVHADIAPFLEQHGGKMFRHVLSVVSGGVYSPARDSWCLASLDYEVVSTSCQDLSNVEEVISHSHTSIIEIKSKFDTQRDGAKRLAVGDWQKVCDYANEKGRFHSFDLDLDSSTEQIQQIAAACIDRSYLIQCLHSLAATRKRRSILLFVDGTGRESIMMGVKITVSKELLEEHIRVLDLVGQTHLQETHDADIHSALPPKYENQQMEFDRMYDLSRAARNLNDPVLGTVNSLKPAYAVLHNVGKTGMDALGQELRGVYPKGVRELGPLHQSLAIVAVTAMRGLRAFRLASAANFKAENLKQDSVSVLRHALNQYGSTSHLIRVAASQLKTNSRGGQVDISTLEIRSNAPPVSWDRLFALRDAAARSPSPLASFSVAELTWFRLNSVPGRLNHSPVFVTGDVNAEDGLTRQKDALACNDCEENSGNHPRNAKKVSVYCSACGVFLGLEPLSQFNGSSSWVVWHTYENISHPLVFSEPYLVPSTVNRSRVFSASAAKKRNNEEFNAALESAQKEQERKRGNLSPVRKLDLDGELS